MAVALADVIRSVVANADRLRGSRAAANEANTKAALIEPVLEALGWDLRDFEQLDREYRVFDGTLLDYALKIDGEKRLFVEAKALTERLDQPSFISQTVNYANNEGVLWCVLTNGIVWRVYKTNEPVNMERKLLFEQGLHEGDAAEAAKSLERISRTAVENGDLDRLGEHTFTDTRVRGALAELAVTPPPELMSALGGVLGKPEVDEDKLRDSLERIFGDFADGRASTRPTRRRSTGTTPARPPSGGRRAQEYTLDHHTGGKPAEILNLFQALDEYGRSLGGDVSRRIRKFYVGYFKGKRSFATVELQRARIIVYLNLTPDPSAPWWSGDSMRDVLEIGHYGMGDTEFSLTSSQQLDELKALVRKAHEQISEPSLCKPLYHACPTLRYATAGEVVPSAGQPRARRSAGPAASPSVARGAGAYRLCVRVSRACLRTPVLGSSSASTSWRR